MRTRRPALMLLVIQTLIILSVAGKYFYERKLCPRVWVRAEQVDPNQPLRGRYIAVRFLVDACSLPRDKGLQFPWHGIGDAASHPVWNWPVTLQAENGRLVARLKEPPRGLGSAPTLTLIEGRPCTLASVQRAAEYFIPDRARNRLDLRAGQELWVEVTVPPQGPPRPIQLAISNGKEFRPVKFN